jgi:hypothetical protein
MMLCSCMQNVFQIASRNKGANQKNKVNERSKNIFDNDFSSLLLMREKCIKKITRAFM